MNGGTRLDSVDVSARSVPPEETLASLEHLRRVQRVTDAALANLTVDQLLDELLVRVREALDADTAAILLLSDGSGELVARAAAGLEEEVEAGVRIPVGRGFAGTIAATGQPLAIYDIDRSIVVNPILKEKGIRSLLGVPLVVQGQTLGVLHVGSLTPREFTAEDTSLLQLVGDRVALAVHAGLYERERAVAKTLQRSLLPERLPGLPGLGLAARYLPARGGEVGGDWYDAFVLPNGTLAVAIGDVVGKGLGASSAMARLRNGLRAYAVEYASPGEVVTQTDRLLQQLYPGDMATVLYGVIDPVHLVFRFACAAHIPPIVRERDGSVRILSVEPGPPLGAAVSGSFAEHREQLRPGSTLVLCTDGLIERRDGSIDQGLRRLGEACASDVPLERRCDQIIEHLLGSEEADDDVALLVMEVAPEAGSTWRTSLPADARRLVNLRMALRRWLTEQDVPLPLQQDILLGSGEAVANAIEHAYGPSGGVIRISAQRSAKSMRIVVRDLGRWRPPRDPHRGRGIRMMRALADSVLISPTGTGTSVELRWDLRDAA